MTLAVVSVRSIGRASGLDPRARRDVGLGELLGLLGFCGMALLDQLSFTGYNTEYSERAAISAGLEHIAVPFRVRRCSVEEASGWRRVSHSLYG